MFPFLFELPAIRGEVLARHVLRIPLDGVEQDVARSLLVLHQLEGAAAPVRSDLGGSLLAAVLLEHPRVLQFAQRAADETPVAFGKLRLGKIGLGRLDSREVFFGMQDLLRGNRRVAKDLTETVPAVAVVQGILEKL